MLSSLQNLLLAAGDPDSLWFPAPRSKFAIEESNPTGHVLLYVCVFFFIVVVGSMTYFIFKYRRKSAKDVVSTVTHNTPIEVIWTIIPLILVMWFFVIGFKGFVSYSTPPSDSIVIDATASQWAFSFKYPNGAESDKLYVPVGKPVRLNMTSLDVTHALYIPNFYISKNMIANRFTDLWFEATKESGENGYPIFCTQYCGKRHSKMMSTIYVLSEEDYSRKLAELDNVFKGPDNKPVAYADVGRKIYEQKCGSCHTTDEKIRNTGPTWDGLWTRDHLFGQSNVPGFVLKATDPDEKKIAYIAESVTQPDAKIVAGFNPGMPPFAGFFSTNAQADPEKDPQEYKKYQKLLAVVEYMKKLSDGKTIQGTSEVYHYDPSKAPVFQEPKGASASASAPATSAATTPASTRP